MDVTKWKHYLVDYHFIIKTDHQFLKYLLEQKLTSTLQHKWLTKLLGLDYEIQYKNGTKNLAVDALSRKGLIEEGEQQEANIMAITVVQSQWIAEVIQSYQQDEECQNLIRQLVINPGLVPHYQLMDGLIKYKQKIYVGKGNNLR